MNPRSSIVHRLLVLVAACGAPTRDLPVRNDAPRDVVTQGQPDCTPGESPPPPVPYQDRHVGESSFMEIEGTGMLRAGHLGPAESALLFALELDPYNLAAHASLVDLYAAAGRPGCVAILRERIVQLGGDSDAPVRQIEIREAAELTLLPDLPLVPIVSDAP